MLDLKKIEPEPYTKDEEKYINYLVKKYGKRLGTKEQKYQIFKTNK